MNNFQLRNRLYSRVRDDHSSAYEPQICMDSNSLASEIPDSREYSIGLLNKSAWLGKSDAKITSQLPPISVCPKIKSTFDFHTMLLQSTPDKFYNPCKDACPKSRHILSADSAAYGCSELHGSASLNDNPSILTSSVHFETEMHEYEDTKIYVEIKADEPVEL